VSLAEVSTRWSLCSGSESKTSPTAKWRPQKPRIIALECVDNGPRTLEEMYAAQKARHARLKMAAMSRAYEERQERLNNELEKRESISAFLRAKAEAESDAPVVIPTRPTVSSISAIVAKEYGVSKVDLLSDRRTDNVVRPRHVIMYLAKALTTSSLPAIAHRLGKRDHTTVIHGVRKIEALLSKVGPLLEKDEFQRDLVVKLSHRLADNSAHSASVVADA
jgi:Bacterial dnaA protein helix-turn-helix